MSVNVLQWIITAYGLTLAGFLMLSGRVGDIYGHKKLFTIGVLLFSLASLTGGLAPSETVLILARVVQGLGAAMASATGLSILAAAFVKIINYMFNDLKYLAFRFFTPSSPYGSSLKSFSSSLYSSDSSSSESVS